MSSGEAWSVFKGRHQGPSVWLSVLPSTYSAPSSGSIQWSPRFKTYMTENEGLVTYPFLPPTTPVENKSKVKNLLLKTKGFSKKKKKLNPAKLSSHLFNWVCARTWTNFLGQEAGLDLWHSPETQNPFFQNGGGKIFIKNLWVFVIRSRRNKC